MEFAFPCKKRAKAPTLQESCQLIFRPGAVRLAWLLHEPTPRFYPLATRDIPCKYHAKAIAGRQGAGNNIGRPLGAVGPRACKKYRENPTKKSE